VISNRNFCNWRPQKSNSNPHKLAQTYQAANGINELMKMIEITSFLLKHLYELMADDYNRAGQDSTSGRQTMVRSQQQRHRQSGHSSSHSSSSLVFRSHQNASRAQETNQQIVSFLANNHLPDLICETFIELLFICVFLAVSWIFVMIVQLHCHQLQQPARIFYCNTKFLASLMYCNNKSHLSAS